MMKEEFEQRTGFLPTQFHYSIIERHYMDFDGGKDAFCEAYINNIHGIASMIQREADQQALTKQAATVKCIKDCKDQIANLERNLEREQGWRPYEIVGNVQQADYKKIVSQLDTKFLSDDEAKDLLYEWYGFVKEKILIHHSVPAYEINRHRQLRESGQWDRLPVYNSTDWNYIRFDCGCMSYELYNDNLCLYLH